MRSTVKTGLLIVQLAWLCPGGVAGAAPTGGTSDGADNKPLMYGLGESIGSRFETRSLGAAAIENSAKSETRALLSHRFNGLSGTPEAASRTSCAAADGVDKRRWTLWFGGPAVIDYRPGNSGAFTFGVGLGPVAVSNSSSRLVDSTTGSAINISPIGEAFYYPSRKASGLAFNLRIGSANSIYFAPGIFYVSRPKGSICGRIGIMAPIGGGASPFLPELAIGFRF